MIYDEMIIDGFKFVFCDGFSNDTFVTLSIDKVTMKAIVDDPNSLREAMSKAWGEADAIEEAGIANQSFSAWRQMYPEREISQLLENKYVDNYAKREAYFYLHPGERRKNKAAKKAPTPGFVYVLEGGDSYKIGCSVDVEKRMATLGSTVPFAIRLVHSFLCDDMLTAEKRLHDNFADKRGNGEWFYLGANDIQAICTIEAYAGGDFEYNHPYPIRWKQDG